MPYQQDAFGNLVWVPSSDDSRGQSGQPPQQPYQRPGTYAPTFDDIPGGDHSIVDWAERGNAGAGDLEDARQRAESANANRYQEIPGSSRREPVYALWSGSPEGVPGRGNIYNLDPRFVGYETTTTRPRSLDRGQYTEDDFIPLLPQDSRGNAQTARTIGSFDPNEPLRKQQEYRDIPMVREYLEWLDTKRKEALERYQETKDHRHKQLADSYAKKYLDFNPENFPSVEQAISAGKSADEIKDLIHNETLNQLHFEKRNLEGIRKKGAVADDLGVLASHKELQKLLQQWVALSRKATAADQDRNLDGNKFRLEMMKIEDKILYIQQQWGKGTNLRWSYGGVVNAKSGGIEEALIHATGPWEKMLQDAVTLSRLNRDEEQEFRRKRAEKRAASSTLFPGEERARPVDPLDAALERDEGQLRVGSSYFQREAEKYEKESEAVPASDEDLAQRKDRGVGYSKNRGYQGLYNAAVRIFTGREYRNLTREERDQKIHEYVDEQLKARIGGPGGRVVPGLSREPVKQANRNYFLARALKHAGDRARGESSAEMQEKASIDNYNKTEAMKDIGGTSPRVTPTAVEALGMVVKGVVNPYSDSAPTVLSRQKDKSADALNAYETTVRRNIKNAEESNDKEGADDWTRKLNNHGYDRQKKQQGMIFDRAFPKLADDPNKERLLRRAWLEQQVNLGADLVEWWKSTLGYSYLAGTRPGAIALSVIDTVNTGSNMLMKAFYGTAAVADLPMFVGGEMDWKSPRLMTAEDALLSYDAMTRSTAQAINQVSEEQLGKYYAEHARIVRGAAGSLGAVFMVAVSGGGLAPLAATFFASTSADGYAEAKNLGRSTLWAISYGTLMGAAEVAPMLIGAKFLKMPGFAKYVMKNPAGQSVLNKEGVSLLQGAYRTGFKRFFKEYGKTVTDELMQEISTAIMQQMTTTAFGIDPEGMSKEQLSMVVYEAAVGTMAATLIGAGGSGFRARAQQSKRQKAVVGALQSKVPGLHTTYQDFALGGVNKDGDIVTHSAYTLIWMSEYLKEMGVGDAVSDFIANPSRTAAKLLFGKKAVEKNGQLESSEVRKRLAAQLKKRKAEFDKKMAAQAERARVVEVESSSPDGTTRVEHIVTTATSQKEAEQKVADAAPTIDGQSVEVVAADALAEDTTLTPDQKKAQEKEQIESLGAEEGLWPVTSEGLPPVPEGTVDVEAETPVTQDPVTEAPFNVEEYHTTEELKAEYERLGPVRDEILLTPEFESEEEARGYYVDEIRRLTEEAPATEAATPEAEAAAIDTAVDDAAAPVEAEVEELSDEAWDDLPLQEQLDKLRGNLDEWGVSKDGTRIQDPEWASGDFTITVEEAQEALDSLKAEQREHEQDIERGELSSREDRSDDIARLKDQIEIAKQRRGDTTEAAPVYDEEGFDQDGFDEEGFDQDGVTRDGLIDVFHGDMSWMRPLEEGSRRKMTIEEVEGYLKDVKNEDIINELKEKIEIAKQRQGDTDQAAPVDTAESLDAKPDDELRAQAEGLGIKHRGLSRAAIIEKILEAPTDDAKQKKRAARAFRDSDNKIQQARDDNDPIALATAAHQLRERGKKFGDDSRVQEADELLAELEEQGYTVDDPMGRRFVDGWVEVEAIAWVEQEGIEHETVVEVRRPIVRGPDGRAVQKGQVVIASPAETATEAPTEAAPAEGPFYAVSKQALDEGQVEPGTNTAVNPMRAWDEETHGPATDAFGESLNPGDVIEDAHGDRWVVTKGGLLAQVDDAGNQTGAFMRIRKRKSRDTAAEYEAATDARGLLATSRLVEKAEGAVWPEKMKPKKKAKPAPTEAAEEIKVGDESKPIVEGKPIGTATHPEYGEVLIMNRTGRDGSMVEINIPNADGSLSGNAQTMMASKLSNVKITEAPTEAAEGEASLDVQDTWGSDSRVWTEEQKEQKESSGLDRAKGDERLGVPESATIVTPESEAGQEAVAFGRALGVDVVFVSDLGTVASGLSVEHRGKPTGVVLVNARTRTEDTAIWAVVAHEIAHSTGIDRLVTELPRDQMEALIKKYLATFPSKPGADAVKAKLAADPESAHREAVAMFVTEFLADPKVRNEILKSNPSLAARILEFVMEVLQKAGIKLDTFTPAQQRVIKELRNKIIPGTPDMADILSRVKNLTDKDLNKEVRDRQLGVVGQDRTQVEIAVAESIMAEQQAALRELDPEKAAEKIQSTGNPVTEDADILSDEEIKALMRQLHGPPEATTEEAAPTEAAPDDAPITKYTRKELMGKKNWHLEQIAEQMGLESYRRKKKHILVDMILGVKIDEESDPKFRRRRSKEDAKKLIESQPRIIQDILEDENGPIQATVEFNRQYNLDAKYILSKMRLTPYKFKLLLEGEKVEGLKGEDSAELTVNFGFDRVAEFPDGNTELWYWKDSDDLHEMLVSWVYNPKPEYRMQGEEAAMEAEALIDMAREYAVSQGLEEEIELEERAEWEAIAREELDKKRGEPGFELEQEPASRVAQDEFEDEGTGTQDRMFRGMDALPGQEDLFDAERLPEAAEQAEFEKDVNSKSGFALNEHAIDVGLTKFEDLSDSEIRARILEVVALQKGKDDWMLSVTLGSPGRYRRWIIADELAAFLGVTKRKLHLLRDAGLVKGFWDGQTMKFKAEHVNELVDEIQAKQKQGKPTPTDVGPLMPEEGPGESVHSKLSKQFSRRVMDRIKEGESEGNAINIEIENYMAWAKELGLDENTAREAAEKFERAAKDVASRAANAPAGTTYVQLEQGVSNQDVEDLYGILGVDTAAVLSKATVDRQMQIEQAHQFYGSIENVMIALDEKYDTLIRSKSGATVVITEIELSSNLQNAMYAALSHLGAELKSLTQSKNELVEKGEGFTSDEALAIDEKINHLHTQLQKYGVLNRAMGSVFGRGLEARKRRAYTYTWVDILMSAAAKKGEVLTPEETAVQRGLHEKLKGNSDRTEKARKAKTENEADEAIQAESKPARTKKARTKTAQTKKTKTKVVSPEIKEMVDRIKKLNKDCK